MLYIREGASCYYGGAGFDNDISGTDTEIKKLGISLSFCFLIIVYNYLGTKRMLDVQKEGQTPWAFAPKSKFISPSLPHKSVSSLA